MVHLNIPSFLRRVWDIVEAYDKRKAIDMLIAADALVCSRIVPEERYNPRSKHPTYVESSISSDKLLDEALQDINILPVHGNIPSNSIAYLITQCLKRKNINHDYVYGVLFGLSFDDRKDNCDAYTNTFCLFRAAIGIFPDGSGSIDVAHD